MKFENTSTMNFYNAIRGMRNALGSWDKMDSQYNGEYFIIGENDTKLAKNLIKAGSADRKFLRQIFISVDITASVYWWKEFDTYKVGTVVNSTSTMHTIAKTSIIPDMFERGDIEVLSKKVKDKARFLDLSSDFDTLKKIQDAETRLNDVIMVLENLRMQYLETGDKYYWKELISLLPQSWLQKRTVTMDYETAYSIYWQRHNHKLTEWHTFCDWELNSLPHMKEFLDIE